MDKTRLRRAWAFSAMSLVLLAVGAAMAQTPARNFPAKPVRIVIGLPPGASIDTLARGLSQELGKIWNSPVLVENRVGAGDVLAATVAAKAAPDGYTILFSTSTNMNTSLFLRHNLPYDPNKDLIPVVGLAQTQALFVASNKVPAATVRELVALARAKPGVLNYGSWDVASAGHLDGEAFGRVSGAQFTHVPYKGGAQVMIALVAGEVDFAFSGLTPAIPLVKQAKIKALAYTGTQRLGVLPQVPTLAEAGFNLKSVGLYSLYAPAGTPKVVIDKIAADTIQVCETATFREKFIYANGMEEFPLQSAALAARLQESAEEFASRVKGLDIQLD